MKYDLSSCNHIEIYLLIRKQDASIYYYYYRRSLLSHLARVLFHLSRHARVYNLARTASAEETVTS